MITNTQNNDVTMIELGGWRMGLQHNWGLLDHGISIT